MHLNLFFCEDATTTANGKLDVQGVYSELYSSGFPAKQDHMTLAGIIEWDREVQGKQTFRIDIVDPENKSIFSIDANTEVEHRPESRPPAISHLIFPLDNLIFTEPGQYRTVISIENDKIFGPSLYLLYSKSGM